MVAHGTGQRVQSVRLTTQQSIVEVRIQKLKPFWFPSETVTVSLNSPGWSGIHDLPASPSPAMGSKARVSKQVYKMDSEMFPKYTILNSGR